MTSYSSKIGTSLSFRAFHFYEGKMWSSIECILQITGDTWSMIYDDSSQPELVGKVVASSTVESILMQSTGKFDKNSKVIFEGDIVKHYRQCFDWNKPDGEEMFLKEELGVVEYRGHGFWIDSEDFGWEGENLWDWNDLEVIGNIYEHSELLK